MNLSRLPSVLVASLLVAGVAVTVCGYGASVVRAHGDGASFEKVVGGVFIDIGYSPEEIIAGTPVPFDFAILDPETGAEISYSDIWVRVARERESFFAGGIHRSEIGATTMLFQFPHAGTYALSVRFQSGGETVAEAAFEVPVLSESGDAAPDDGEGFPLLPLSLLFLGFGVGCASGWVSSRMISSSKRSHT